MAKQKYCKDHYERITELGLEVHRLWKIGVDVSLWAIQQSKKYNKFYSAASNVSISWQEVLVAAGISLDKVIKNRQWSKDHYDRLTELALEAHGLWERGVKVPVGGFQKDKRYKRLYLAASRKDISWSEVLVAACVPLDEAIKKVRMRRWPKDHYECLTELALEAHQLWKSGVDVSSSAIQNSRKYGRFFSATESAGITWQEVLVAAGVPLDKFIKIRKWSTDHYKRLTELALEIHKLWKNGVDVSCSAIKQSKKYNKFYSAASRASISWQEVLVAAGIPLDRFIKYRTWSEDHYDRLSELALEVHQLWKSGLDVSSSGIQKSGKYGKFIDAGRYAGISWQEVLIAAGIPLDKVIKNG